MNFKQPLFIFGLALSISSFNANATLTSYNANGVDLVYSSVSNVTWTKDANLLGSMMISQGYDSLVNAIIAASPIVHDTPNDFDTPPGSGLHTVSTIDFNKSVLGGASWFGAKAFIKYLNAIKYADTNSWSMPSAGIDPQTGYPGIIYQPSGSKLSELFYDELGGSQGNRIPNSNYFNNEKDTEYWSNTEYSYGQNPDSINPNNAWNFATSNGSQSLRNKSASLSFVWAFSEGSIKALPTSAVPVPSAVWFMGTGLIGMLGLKRRALAQ